ncbi:MAG TPA: signal peptidase I [Nitrososphaerales archaeon]|nr:signal peptidase I [Nitrososphaerales archaeon]
MAAARTIAFAAAFIIFLVVFAFALETYTRRVDGTSMLPTLVEGDLVVIENSPASSIHVGDIIVYGGPCSAISVDGAVAPVIHRVVSMVALGFITKGDNNGYTDQAVGIARSPITPACLQGKVIFVVPYIERIASLPDGLNYIIAALIVVAVVGYEFLGGRKDAEEHPTPSAEPTSPPQ